MMLLRIRKHSVKNPTLRWGLLFALALFYLPSLASPIESTADIHFTSKIGRIVNSEGQFIPYVSLIFQNSELFVLSDASGQFVINSKVALDDSVFIQRIGYQQKHITAIELFDQNEISLEATVLPMQSIEIRGEHKKANDIALKALSQYTKSSGIGTIDHGKMLYRIPGISMKTYGGPAGISTLSMDGGPSSHTKILVNGIDITSAQNGETDISQLPLPLIESMSYMPYDISGNNSGSIDGVVMLETGNQQNHVSLSGGSFGHQAYDINLRKQLGRFWTNLQIGKRLEDGNYQVSWDSEAFDRRNNNMKQEFANFQFSSIIRPDLIWQFTAIGSRQSRGVAGLVWSPDTLSHRDDQLQIMGSSLAWIRTSGSTHIQLANRRSWENYSNPYLNIDSNHKLQNLQLNFKNEQSIGQSTTLFFDMSYHRDWIQSNATTNHQRDSYSTSITPVLSFRDVVKLIPSFRIQHSPNLYSQSLKDFQIQIPIEAGPLSTIAASHAEVFRYPSFNDLFWEPGGNPDLEPEETQVSTAQFQFDMYSLGNLMLQWQRKDSDNLIQWMPVHSYWQPGNVQSASRESRKIIWQFDYSRWHLAAFAHYTHIETKDIKLKKRLRYAPDKTSALGLTWTPPPFEINLQYNYVSDRIGMYDYPIDTIIRSTELWSLSIAHTWALKTGALTVVLAGDNLGDVSYETIRGYPEPGRSTRLSATYYF